MLILAWSITCLVMDLRVRKLPNWLMLSGHIMATLVLIVTGQSLLGATPVAAIFAWLLALVLTLPAYMLKWLGAGDVKMLAAIGLLTGLNVMLASYAIAGVLILLVVIGSLMWSRTVPWLNLKLARVHLQLPAIPPSGRQKIPFGALLAIGLMTALVMLQTGILSV